MLLLGVVVVVVVAAVVVVVVVGSVGSVDSGGNVLLWSGRISGTQAKGVTPKTGGSPETKMINIYRQSLLSPEEGGVFGRSKFVAQASRYRMAFSARTPPSSPL